MFTLTASFVAIAILYLVWRCTRNHFATRDLANLPGPPSGSFLKGNFGQLYNIYGFDFHMKIAEQFGRVIGIYGPFNTRQLYIFDPKAVHHILVKDQYVFEETTAFLTSNSIVFGDGLLASLGERHRKQRKLLNPVFSIAHIRNMAIKLKIDRGEEEIDILYWMTRAALEMIGQCGLGYSFDTLTEDTVPHPFSKAAKDLVWVTLDCFRKLDVNRQYSPALFHFEFEREFLLTTLVKIGSPQFRKWAVDVLALGSKNLRRLRDLVWVMDDTTTKIFQEKKSALARGEKGQGKDILSILMRANLEAAEEDRLPDIEVQGQLS
ncbi:hypothetical protein H0H93_009873 [Arthromyces matolae]|nr:hypothetical protein H0H93_009873 [Arthromyces matolae]